MVSLNILIVSLNILMVFCEYSDGILWIFWCYPCEDSEGITVKILMVTLWILMVSLQPENKTFLLIYFL